MAEHDETMSPDASPDVVPRRGGVRRANNLPLYIIFSIAGVFLIIVLMVAADRAKNQNRPATVKQEVAGNTDALALQITGDRQDGVIPAENVTPPAIPVLTDFSEPTVAPVLIATPNLDSPPLPPANVQNSSGQVDPREQERQRIRDRKKQELEAAIKAKTGVAGIASRSPGSSNGDFDRAPVTRDEVLTRLAAVRQQIDAVTKDDPTAAYQARLEQIKAAGLGDTSTPVNLAPPALVPASDTAVTTPGAPGRKTDRFKLDSQIQAPRTPYELRAGFVLPATLISGINSQLPGQIIGQISQHVYDTATGKHILFPQGSRLVGIYSSDVAFGQARVLVTWQRVVFPDGKALDIGEQPGADGAGFAGFSDKVNNHYVRTFASALLVSLVTAGIAQSQPREDVNNNTQSFSSAISESLGQQFGQVTAQLIAKNINIAPTLQIRPGYRFNVMVIKDMTFSKPYQAFDY